MKVDRQGEDPIAILVERLREMRGNMTEHVETYEPLCREAADVIRSQAGRIQKLEERLEITHAYRYDPKSTGSEELVRFEIPAGERDTFPDGITARDATIGLQDDRIKKQAERIARLEEALKPFVDEFQQYHQHRPIEADAVRVHMTGVRCYFTIGDLRRASTALHGQKEEGV